ncbi:MAG: helix-turn-helix domain-containing protein [Eubacteriales bacterium]|nr:helix-turn-helix domain-containing protein [Eubacteriales bacterium]
MSAKLARLIKEARTNAGYTQQELAQRVYGLSASDISKAERNEKTLTTEQLKDIARATGVTQKSLLDAATGSRSTSRSGSSNYYNTYTMKLSVSEKKLVELYRNANTDTKKAAIRVLKGESKDTNDLIADLFGSAVDAFLKK